MSITTNLQEAAALVANAGAHVTFLFQGEPGIGKSAMLDTLAIQTGLKPVYVDCTILDVGDVQMPRVTDLSVTFVPNGMFVSDEPLLVMLDELGKATRAVRNALLPLLYERRVGAYPLPKGSIVFATTNLATDGVGDTMEAHARNRVCQVQIRKPSAKEWVKWAQAHNVHPAVTGWVHEFPHSLQSYADGGDDNPYIFNPRRPTPAFVTPRSLVAASNIIVAADMSNAFTPSSLFAALAGAIGAPAAADMEAFLELRHEVSGVWSAILRDGNTAPVPANPMSHLLIVQQSLFRLLQDPDPVIITQWFRYLQRLPREVQALFVSQAGEHGTLMSAMYHTGPDLRAWAVENRWMNS
jgi:hypothetical protein